MLGRTLFAIMLYVNSYSGIKRVSLHCQNEKKAGRRRATKGETSMMGSCAAGSVAAEDERKSSFRAKPLCLILGLALGFLEPTSLGAAEPIKIGVVAPLTGPLADAGRYGVQGAKLAVEEVNK